MAPAPIASVTSPSMRDVAVRGIDREVSLRVVCHATARVDAAAWSKLDRMEDGKWSIR
jgi:hypothetical protein